MVCNHLTLSTLIFKLLKLKLLTMFVNIPALGLLSGSYASGSQNTAYLCFWCSSCLIILVSLLSVLTLRRPAETYLDSVSKLPARDWHAQVAHARPCLSGVGVSWSEVGVSCSLQRSMPAHSFPAGARGGCLTVFWLVGWSLWPRCGFCPAVMSPRERSTPPADRTDNWSLSGDFRLYH